MVGGMTIGIHEKAVRIPGLFGAQRFDGLIEFLLDFGRQYRDGGGRGRAIRAAR